MPQIPTRTHRVHQGHSCVARKLHSATVIDRYAGAGLLSFAFQEEGFQILRAIERDSVAAETYSRNLGQHIEVNDIRNVRPDGRCDVLIAGPPCQGFSTLGTRNPRDPRNALSLEVVKWAKAVRPSVIVIENVPAFLKSAVWQNVARTLRCMGYQVEAHVLEAHDFGVPQVRRRSFTVASFAGGFSPISAGRKRVRTVREAWRGLPRLPDGQNHHYSPQPSDLALARMQVIPSGGDKRDVMRRAPDLVPRSWWSLPGEATGVWGRLEWDKPSNTLRTGLLNASKGRHIHPDQNRVISLREAARLHSIPDGWAFEGLPTQIARQIGNSVPPMLGRAIARGVRKRFF